MSTESPLAIGTRRELFVDDCVVDTVDGCRLRMYEPRDEGEVLAFDQPWEGIHSQCGSVLRFGDEYRLYYRGLGEKEASSCTCLATSPDGRVWTRPVLGRFELGGSRQNNAVLARQAPFSMNFIPFRDPCPGIPDAERYKAVAGISLRGGLFAFASADGLAWQRVSDSPILTNDTLAFDSQNVAFWSAAEDCYVCYCRTWKDGNRWVSRSTSPDFRQWSPKEEMLFRHRGGPAPTEEMYTTATQPYYRAPHIYVALPRRFMKGRRVLSESEAEALGVSPPQRDSCSDTILMTSRGGNVYDRTFLEAFLRPGADRRNWSSRAGTVAVGILPTGDRELSIYRTMHYGCPSVHVRRFSLRLDGFASLSAGAAGGRLTTRPLTFSGSSLVLNYATSAAGHVRVEIQDEAGRPIPGYSLAECSLLIGDEIARTVTWGDRPGVARLAGRPVRFLFELRDADVFAFHTPAPAAECGGT